MSENIVCIFITVGLFALTAAWVPFLDSVHHAFARVWTEHDTAAEQDDNKSLEAALEI